MLKLNVSRVQQYLEWFKTKIYLDGISNNAKSRVIKRGQVYWCHFGIGIGSEMSKQTPRPCVILQNDIANYHSPNTIVAPITHDEDNYPTLIPIPEYYNSNGEKVLDGKINVANIVCISKARLTDRIEDKKGTIKLNLKDVDESLAKSLSLMEYYKKLKDKLKKRDKRIEDLVTQRNGLEDFLSDLCEELHVDDKSLIIGKIQELQNLVDTKQRL